MAPLIGAKLKEKHTTAWLDSLAGHLYPGEEINVLAKTTMIRPMVDALGVTNARVIAFQGSELGSKGIKRELATDQIVEVRIHKRNLVIIDRDGEGISFGALLEADTDMVADAIRQLIASGTPANVRTAIAARVEERTRLSDAWARVEVIGKMPSARVWKTLKDNSTAGDVPLFVIGSGTSGVFAAFRDRCMIVKVGGMTSMMAGSLGGGRITTFHYTEVTGIEYNSGFINGVLEVLTPSYQGSANKDYWRGVTKSRNADSNDPWTLSNTLPLDKPTYQMALPRLNKMRQHIAEAKRPQVVVSQAPAAPVSNGQNGLADELAKLASLRDRGVLDEDEFQTAKRAALARYTA